MSVNELLELWRDGSISETELRDLTAQLAGPDHRDDLLAAWLVESALPQMLGDAVVAQVQERKIVPMPGAKFRFRSFWRSGAIAAAACIALAAVCARLLVHRPVQTRSNLTQALASAQKAIAGMPAPSTSAFPAWDSPTSSMLDLPRLPQ
jgi:hypothetical protein